MDKEQFEESPVVVSDTRSGKPQTSLQLLQSALVTEIWSNIEI